MRPLYDPELVRPMWEELTRCGVQPLKTIAAVDEMLRKQGTTLVMVNSVCGCAGGTGRPGVTLALQHRIIPDYLTTVFAGVDREATERAREYMVGMPTSSPSVALFKYSRLVHMLERRHFERMTNDQVAQSLAAAFDEHCSRQGPSVPKEVYEEAVRARQRSWNVPLYNPLARG